MAWAALARKNITATAAKVQEREEHPDGSMYAEIPSKLNDTLHILFSVVVIDPGSEHILLVRDPDSQAMSPSAPFELPQFDPSDALGAIKALQSFASSSLYLIEGFLETNDFPLAEAVRQTCKIQTGHDVEVQGFMCVESYLQGLRRNFLRLTAVAFSQPSDQYGRVSFAESSYLPHVWLDLRMILQPDCTLLRSQDFCPYLATFLKQHSEDESFLSHRHKQLTHSSTVDIASNGFNSLRLRVAAYHRPTGRLLLVRPFKLAASLRSSHVGVTHEEDAWVLPETHQDVRGGETLGFAAKRLMMTAFGVGVDHAGVLMIEHDHQAPNVAPRVTLLAIADGDPAPFDHAVASSGTASTHSEIPADILAAVAAAQSKATADRLANVTLNSAAMPASTAEHSGGKKSKSHWKWVLSHEIKSALHSPSSPSPESSVSSSCPTWNHLSEKLELISREISRVSVESSNAIADLQESLASNSGSGPSLAPNSSLREVKSDAAVAVNPLEVLTSRFAIPLMDL